MVQRRDERVSVATISKQNYNKMDKPLCRHCGKPGYQIGKCYRLLGFPPGFEFNKTQINSKSVILGEKDDVSKQTALS